jgi:hypothetical protein
MAGIRSNAGGQLLNQYLVARIFAFDDDQSDARCPAREDARSNAGRRTKHTTSHTTHLLTTPARAL